MRRKIIVFVAIATFAMLVTVFSSPVINASTAVLGPDTSTTSNLTNNINAQTNLISSLNVSFPSVHKVVIGNAVWNKYSPSFLQTTFENAINSSSTSAVVFYHDPTTRIASYNLLLNALKSNGISIPVQLAHAMNGNKRNLHLDKMIYTSPELVLTFNPLGVYIVNESTSSFSGIVWAIDNAIHPHHPVVLYAPSSNNLILPDSITNNGFTFIGQIGWYTSWATGPTGYSSSGNVLKMEVLSNFYEASQTTSQGTYYFFLNYNEQTGYGNSNSGPWWNYYEISYNPNNYYSSVNWLTLEWPGQMVYDWGPKNSGSNTVVTYGLSAGISNGGVSIGASISYSVPGGLSIKWRDSSDPAAGYVNTTENFGASTGVTYTVEPSSVGEINPTKSGGYLPMIINEYFKDWSYTTGYPLLRWPTAWTTITKASITLEANTVYA